jgi:hypothetical protein
LNKPSLTEALVAAKDALAPIAARCDEAVRADDTDRDGVSVKTGLLRAARDAHDVAVAALAPSVGVAAAGSVAEALSAAKAAFAKIAEHGTVMARLEPDAHDALTHALERIASLEQGDALELAASLPMVKPLVWEEVLDGGFLRAEPVTGAVEVAVHAPNATELVLAAEERHRIRILSALDLPSPATASEPFDDVEDLVRTDGCSIATADTEAALEAFVNWMDGRQRAVVLAAGPEFAQFEKPMGLLAVNGCVNALRVLDHRVDGANNHSYRLTTLGILAQAMLRQMGDTPEYQPPWDGNLLVFRVPPKAPPEAELEVLAANMGLLPRDAEADEETPAPGAAR